MQIFHIDQDATPSEWTYTDGSWADISTTICDAQDAIPGEPVAVSQSNNGSGRHIEYFFATTGNQITKRAANSPEPGGRFQGTLATFEVDEPEGLSTEAKTGLGVGLGVPLAALIPA